MLYRTIKISHHDLILLSFQFKSLLNYRGVEGADTWVMSLKMQRSRKVEKTQEEDREN